jgi:hypothetical protein
MSVYKLPYYVLYETSAVPKSDDDNSISNLGGEYIDYYCIYFAKSMFSTELYMRYDNYLEKWMTDRYIDPTIVKYGYTTPSYERDGATYTCAKYSFETPYNILKLHIEHSEEDPDTVFVCSSITSKLISIYSDSSAQEEKTLLEKYLIETRDIIVSTNQEITDEYYEEQRLECAIEYARDHC